MSYVCKECGSTDVEYKIWYKPNTGQLMGDAEGEEGWCNQCDELKDIIFKEEEE